MPKFRVFVLLALFALLMSSACKNGTAQVETREHAAMEAAEIPQEAVCVLSAMEGYEGVAGELVFKQEVGYVHVTGKVTGLTPGKHGCHIHEFGDLRDPKGTSAGGHYNPQGTPHGGPDAPQHHAGDLGNIEANGQGVAQVDKQAHGLMLHLALGRSIVVHAGEDDLQSQPSGAAGDRAAVGVIGIAQAN